MQSINREVGAEGSMEQNRGPTKRNLIQRLYRLAIASKDEVAKQTKV